MDTKRAQVLAMLFEAGFAKGRCMGCQEAEDPKHCTGQSPSPKKMQALIDGIKSFGLDPHTVVNAVQQRNSNWRKFELEVNLGFRGVCINPEDLAEIVVVLLSVHVLP